MSLHELSAAVRAIEPSSAIEEKLRLEFRHQRLVGVGTKRSSRRSWSYAAAAAVILILFGALVAVTLFSSSNGTPDNRTAKVIEPEPVKSEATPTPTPEPQQVNVPAPKREERRPPKLRTPSKGVQKPKNLEAVAQVTPTTSINSRAEEVATDFLPIGYANALNVQEGGQLIRVELPRSAMAKFGLPVNMDRYDERVKADVLVSADGMARAIRFVQ